MALRVGRPVLDWAVNVFAFVYSYWSFILMGLVAVALVLWGRRDALLRDNSPEDLRGLGLVLLALSLLCLGAAVCCWLLDTPAFSREFGALAIFFLAVGLWFLRVALPRRR